MYLVKIKQRRPRLYYYILVMPVEIRTLAPTLTAAGYRFPLETTEASEDGLPWLRTSSDIGKLCTNCSRLNFPWLFTQALSGHTVTTGSQMALLSDGICLGLHKDISSRSRCEFCQLIIHALEYGADIEMLNQYNDWSHKEVWINNHFFDTRGSVVMVPVADGIERVARLGIWLKSGAEEDVVFKHGGRQVMIQQVSATRGSQTSVAGRALSSSSADLVQTIRNWIYPCSLQSGAETAARPHVATSIRLIDTRNGCVIGPVSGRRYVALR